MQRSNEKLPHRSNLGPKLVLLNCISAFKLVCLKNFSSTMASASTATQSVLGQVAAGGDSSRQSSWNSLVYSGLRAAINLMPDSFQYNQALNLSSKDELKEICSFAAAFLGNCQAQGHLKWHYMDAVIKVLQNSDDLDRYVPDTAQRQQYTASDSVLTLFNSSSGPTRTWETMWDENRQIWSNHISKSQLLKSARDCKQLYHSMILQGETLMRLRATSVSSP